MEALGESKTPRHWVKAYNKIKNKISLYLLELDRVANLFEEERFH